MKKLSIALALSLTLGFAVSTALAADGKALYAKCAGCHGADGAKTAQSKALKGMSAATVTTALEGYKAKKFGGAKKAVMEGQSATLSADDIKALAAYVSKF